MLRFIIISAKKAAEGGKRQGNALYLHGRIDLAMSTSTASVRKGETRAAKSTEAFVREEGLSISSSPFTLPLGKRLSVRLYGDCRPNILEVAPLHKGLVLVIDGRELIEEGTGFGVPVVKYEDKTYFSSSAECWNLEDVDYPTLMKSFVLDTVSHKRIGKAAYINDRFYSFVHRLFERAYLAHKSLRPVFNMLMELRGTVKVQTEFVRVKPRGTVKVKYVCQPGNISIKIDLSDLEFAGCKEIVILNEQGSTFFREYLDSDGLRLFDEKIGPWEAVMAEEASLSDMRETLAFTLDRRNSSVLFRGWEKTRGRFSWAGLGYSLRSRILAFDYVIKLKVAGN